MVAAQMRHPMVIDPAGPSIMQSPGQNDALRKPSMNTNCARQSTSRGLRSKHPQVRTSARGKNTSSPLDPPMTAFGMSRPSTKSTLCRGSGPPLVGRATSMLAERAWQQYLQKRTVSVRRPWASERIRFRGSALRAGCGVRQVRSNQVMGRR